MKTLGVQLAHIQSALRVFGGPVRCGGARYNTHDVITIYRSVSSGKQRSAAGFVVANYYYVNYTKQRFTSCRCSAAHGRGREIETYPLHGTGSGANGSAANGKREKDRGKKKKKRQNRTKAHGNIRQKLSGGRYLAGIRPLYGRIIIKQVHIIMNKKQDGTQ